MSQPDIRVEEWKEIRTVFSKFDDRIHGLRKYGFTFVTALLTADALLLPFPVGSTPALPDSAKFAVLGVTVILIVGLKFSERGYQFYLEAAMSRATILEAQLNLETSKMIKDVVAMKKGSRYSKATYYLLEGAVILLAYVVLPWIPAFIITIAAVAEGYYSEKKVEKDLRRDLDYVDWTVSKLEYKQGEQLKITITNLTQRDFMFDPNLPDELWWMISHQNDPKVSLKFGIDIPVEVKRNQSYTWLWDIPIDYRVGIHKITTMTRNAPLLLTKRVEIKPRSTVSK